jgi:hypothetical protein
MKKHSKKKNNTKKPLVNSSTVLSRLPNQKLAIDLLSQMMVEQDENYAVEYGDDENEHLSPDGIPYDSAMYRQTFKQE